MRLGDSVVGIALIRLHGMASHSQSSSLADFDYYNYTHSASSSLSNGSGPPQSSTQPRPLSREQVKQPVRKQTSLAQISVPSFSAFRSQASSIPVLSPHGTRRKHPPFPAHLPRAHSVSITEQASPRLVDPTSRPLSLDSPRLDPPTGFTTGISPPILEEDAPEQDER